MKSINRFSLMIGIFVLLALSGVSGLGITPGRTTLNFEHKLEKEVAFSVLNSEHKNMDIVLLVQGELNESITLFDSSVSFLPSEDSKSFKYKVNLPPNLKPGLHTAEVMALELPKLSQDGTYVGATVAVTSQLYVYVPYPGKYVDFDLNILDSEQNSTATFIVPVVSRGKTGIGEVRGVIDIYTSLNERVATIDTDFASLDPGSRTELSAKWFVDVNSGDYLAKVTLLYDNQVGYMEKEFSVGKNMLSIESILVNEFSLGEIAKLQILVENRWNKELEGVFANLLVYNEDEQVMADIKSAAEDIPSLSRKELVAYWDTIGVQEGEYDGKLMVHYGEKSSDRNLLLRISADNLDITGVGYAIRGERGGGVNMVTVLLVLVIILLIVNVSWFVFFKRFSRGKK